MLSRIVLWPSCKRAHSWNTLGLRDRARLAEETRACRLGTHRERGTHVKMKCLEGRYTQYPCEESWKFPSLTGWMMGLEIHGIRRRDEGTKEKKNFEELRRKYWNRWNLKIRKVWRFLSDVYLRVSEGNS